VVSNARISWWIPRCTFLAEIIRPYCCYGYIFLHNVSCPFSTQNASERTQSAHEVIKTWCVFKSFFQDVFVLRIVFAKYSNGPLSSRCNWTRFIVHECCIYCLIFFLAYFSLRIWMSRSPKKLYNYTTKSFFELEMGH